VGVGDGAQIRPKATGWLLTAFGWSVAAKAVDASAQGLTVNNSVTVPLTVPLPGPALNEKLRCFVSEGVPGTVAVPVTAPPTWEPAGAFA
jgi:hypothetical protein